MSCVNSFFTLIFFLFRFGWDSIIQAFFYCCFVWPSANEFMLNRNRIIAIMSILLCFFFSCHSQNAEQPSLSSIDTFLWSLFCRFAIISHFIALNITSTLLKYGKRILGENEPQTVTRQKKYIDEIKSL